MTVPTTADSRSGAPTDTGPTTGSGPGGPAGRPVRRRPAWMPSPILGAVIVGAWVLAIVAELTGRAHLVHHHDLVEGTLPVAATLALFLVAWQAHVAAMMLPSSLPLIALFRRASQGQPHPVAARAAFIGGYAVVWTGFGIVMLGGDSLLHAGVDRWPALDQPSVIGGGALLIAGAFQFSSLKDQCLRQCRHPAVFLTAHYRRGVGAAWNLGVRHGVFCLGCCWALMVVMFMVGIANLAWMAPLALVMLYEKTGAGGRRAAAPIGVVLIALGSLVLLDPAWLPGALGGHTH